MGSQLFDAGLERRPVGKSVFDGDGVLGVCQPGLRPLALQLAQQFLGLFSEMFEIWKCGKLPRHHTPPLLTGVR
jgi:hypothetical protein